MSKDLVVCAETASEVKQWHRGRVGSKGLQKSKYWGHRFSDRSHYWLVLVMVHLLSRRLCSGPGGARGDPLSFENLTKRNPVLSVLPYTVYLFPSMSARVHCLGLHCVACSNLTMVSSNLTCLLALLSPLHLHAWISFFSVAMIKHWL